MQDKVSPVEQEFDACAGAGFGFAGIMRASLDCVSAEGILFLWLLASQAVSVGGDQGGAVAWLEDQVATLSMRSEQLGVWLKTRIRQSWATWIPIILLSNEGDRDVTWSKYCSAYPALSEEEAAVRHLLFVLLSQHGRRLYSEEGLRTSQVGGSPQHCAVARLGMTARQLRDNETLPEQRRNIYAAWRDALLIVHGRLPSRISRGFAPTWPVFEDLVLSLLYVADWLLEEEPHRIPGFVDDYAQRPDERLKPNELTLSAALYGWFEGYSRTGHLVQERSWRSLLARQAMAIAISRAWPIEDGSYLWDPAVFYSTEEGTLTALRRFLHLVEVQQEDTVIVKHSLNEITHMWETESLSRVTHHSAEYRLPPSLVFRLECQ